MNLIHGTICDDVTARKALSHLEEDILKSLQEPAPDTETVIRAADALSRELDKPENRALLVRTGMTEDKAAREIKKAAQQLSAPVLRARLREELGEIGEPALRTDENDTIIRRAYRPMGTILHVTAGNAEGLPAYSVVEGLLTGNINVVKTAGEDTGLSVLLLKYLVELEPKLRDRVYVFDLSSSDFNVVLNLVAPADVIAVWGSDETVQSIRELALPQTRIVEWGHRFSFAYVSGEPSDEELRGLCFNICDTEQLLCNSCQGIYVNTDSYAEAERFAERFLPILEQTAALFPTVIPEPVRARKTLEIFTMFLEEKEEVQRVLKGRGCSVTVKEDPLPEDAVQLRNLWVKPLPKEKLFETLRHRIGMLQTVALLCGEEERTDLAELLFACGAARVTSGRNMSEHPFGLPHDGEFSLRRYVKIVTEDR